MSTLGPVYDEHVDSERLERQMDRIRSLMLDGQWRSLAEITEQTGIPEASASSDLRHLRKDRFGAHLVEKRRRVPKCGLWEYRVSLPDPDAQLALGWS